MPWVKLDDHFDENPKILSVGPLGMALWVTGLAYCNRNLTDGFIPTAIAVRLLSVQFEDPEDGSDVTVLVGGSRSVDDEQIGFVPDRYYGANLLVSAGLWERVPGGYQIHDYSDYQPTRAEVEAERATKQAAGKAGGQASAQARAKRRAQANSQAPAEAGAQAGAQAKSKPDPDPDPDPTASYEAAAAREGAPAAPAEEPELSETDQAVGRLCRAWEQATGTTVPPLVGDRMADWIDRLPEEVIAKAIAETGINGKRAWNYTESILKRYETEGWEDKPKPTPIVQRQQQERIPTAEEVFEQIRNRPAVPVPDELEYLRANNPEAYERELALRERTRVKLAAHMAANGQAT